MRCPKCYSETSAEAPNCPSCKLPTPKGRFAAPKTGTIKQVKSVDKKKVTKSKIDFGVLLPNLPGARTMIWVILFMIMGASGFLAYRYVYSGSNKIDAQPALQAMNQLRHLPSKEAGKSIDDYLKAEIKKSGEAGKLVSHQGWTIKAYDKNTYLISFSYDEKEAKMSADWVVDPKTNTFTPVSELATAVHKQEKEN